MRTLIETLCHMRHASTLRRGLERLSNSRTRSLRVEGLEDRRLLSINNPVGDVFPLAADTAVQSLWLEESEPTVDPADLASLSLQLDYTDNGVQGRLSVPGLVWEVVQADGADFIQLDVPGWGLTQEVGRPELPIYRASIQIPQNVDVSTSFELGQVSLFGTQSWVFPKQPEQPEIDLPPEAFEFVIDTDYYTQYTEGTSTDAEILWVSNPMEAGQRSSVALEFSPFQYDPITGEIALVTEVTFDLTFEPTEAAAFTEGASEFVSSAGAADYIIITADAFYEEVLPLAQWKHKMGFKTYVAKMSEVGTTQTDIYNFLRSAYLADTNRPEYVLLVGDHENVPSFEIVGHPYHGDEHVWHTDYEYTRLGGSDVVADVALCRLPGDTEAQIITMVNKILTYEINPDLGNWYDDFLGAGQFQDSEGEDDPNFIEDRWFMEDIHRVTDFLGGDYDFWSSTDPYNQGYTVHTNLVWGSGGTYNQNTLYYKSSNYTGGITHPSPVPDAWKFKANESISTVINNGVALVLHRDHGSTSGWGSPSFRTSNVNSLNNGDRLPVVFSINCATGWFDDGDYFGESWMRNANGGAVAFTGAMRVSYSGPNDTFHVGVFDAMWPNYDTGWSSSNFSNTWRFGDVLNYAKDRTFSGLGYSSSSALLVARMFNGFGDPSMMMRTAVPQTLDVAYVPNIFVGTASDYVVQVTRDGVAVPDAMVCISTENGDDYWVGTTNANGNVTFAGLSPTEVGTYDLVVTEHNSIPFQVTVESRINGIDLLGTAMAIDPYNLFGNDGTAAVDFLIYNAGDTPAGGFDIQFFLSDDAIINPATDTPLSLVSSGESYHVGSLDAQATHTASVTLNVPTEDPFGTDNVYFIGMVIDVADAIEEVDEGNNANRGNGVDRVTVEYTDPIVTLPFTETWEDSTTPRPWWEVHEGTQGRVQITSSNGPFEGSRHLTLDDSVDDSTYSLNQLILHVNLANERAVVLSFANREWSDEDHSQDSVSVSVDGGQSWHDVVALTGANSTAEYIERSYFLDDLGLTYSEETLIRFQQYDNSSINGSTDTDGMALDNIRLYSVAGILDHFEWAPIDSPQMFGEPIPVTLSAMDRGGVPVLDYEGTVDLSAWTGVGTLHSTDFETDDGGWIATATWSPGDWEWGIPTSGPGAAHSGQKVWATNLDGNYTNASGTSFLSQTFDFTGYTDLELTWWQWCDLRGLLDAAEVFVNGDLVYERDTADAPTAYEQITVDLSPYDNMSSVEISFEFYANWLMEDPGWYVDDITIEGVEAIEVSLVPETAAHFVNGVWSEEVTVMETADGVCLMADDGKGLTAKSNVFDVVPGTIRDYGDAPSSTVGSSLTTTVTGGNSAEGNMFDVTALNTLVINTIDVYPRWNSDFQVYYKAGSYVGFEHDPAAWTLIGVASVEAGGSGVLVPLPLPIDVAIPAGETYSFYVAASSGGIWYTNGTEAGAVCASDENLQIKEGTGNKGIFGDVYSPRIFNGRIHYTAGLTYPTSVLEGGARHMAEGPMLGASRDVESNGQPSAGAVGDGGDEDGIAFDPATLLASPFHANHAAKVEVTLTNADPYENYLDAWIDFNLDGDWNDPGEQIFTSYNLGTADGTQVLTFTIPQDTGNNVKADETYARFRLSTVGGLGPDGSASDGEVEDYFITLLADTQPPPGDATGDGLVNADDVRVLAQYWLTQEDATWWMGDFNDDGKVNDLDASILAANWTPDLPEQTPVDTPALPEDASPVVPLEVAVRQSMPIGPRRLGASLLAPPALVQPLSTLVYPGAVERVAYVRQALPVEGLACTISPENPVDQAAAHDVALAESVAEPARLYGPLAQAVEMQQLRMSRPTLENLPRRNTRIVDLALQGYWQ
ncbi:MAG: hypothetical protein JW818_05840 [Pirellulales bacterium]|nr:hypothetical protein [Pirellulales bacterium]